MTYPDRILKTFSTKIEVNFFTKEYRFIQKYTKITSHSTRLSTVVTVPSHEQESLVTNLTTCLLIRIETYINPPLLVISPFITQLCELNLVSGSSNNSSSVYSRRYETYRGGFELQL